MTRTAPSLGIRLGLLATGIIILLWLPIEDQGTNGATALAVCAAVFASLRAGVRVPPGQRVLLVGVGMAAGMAVAPLAAGLMVIKLGIHAHTIPDFFVDDFRLVLFRTPAFTIAGLFSGFGWYLLGNDHAGE